MFSYVLDISFFMEPTFEKSAEVELLLQTNPLSPSWYQLAGSGRVERILHSSLSLMVSLMVSPNSHTLLPGKCWVLCSCCDAFVTTKECSLIPIKTQTQSFLGVMFERILFSEKMQVSHTDPRLWLWMFHQVHQLASSSATLRARVTYQELYLWGSLPWEWERLYRCTKEHVHICRCSSDCLNSSLMCCCLNKVSQLLQIPTSTEEASSTTKHDCSGRFCVSNLKKTWHQMYSQNQVGCF